MSFAPFPNLDLLSVHLDTMVDLDAMDSYVVIRLVVDDGQHEVVAFQTTSEEARDLGLQLIEAAEVSEVEAHMFLSLRARKMPEQEIMDIISDLAKSRHRHEHGEDCT